MNSERWKRVEQLYHAAVKLAESERVSFLENSCCGDVALRQMDFRGRLVSFSAGSAEVFNEHQVAATSIELRVEEVALIRGDRKGSLLAPRERDNWGHFAGCEF